MGRGGSGQMLRGENSKGSQHTQGRNEEKTDRRRKNKKEKRFHEKHAQEGEGM